MRYIIGWKIYTREKISKSKMQYKKLEKNFVFKKKFISWKMDIVNVEVKGKRPSSKN